ncbi:hypothetical protein Ancab_031079 [Ancistrocladus abbreviatus]
MVITVLVLGLLFSSLDTTAAGVGTCYGMQGNNLPSFQQVIAQYHQNNIQRMRIYYPVPGLLRALGGSNIELMLGIPNDSLQSIASSQANANSWVQNNVKNYPNVKFRYIVVGNEIRPNNGASRYAQFLLPAMQNIQNAIKQFGLGNQIKVSSSFDLGIVVNTFPPSNGQFNPGIRSFIDPIIRFLVNNRAPLLMNVYPYFSYASNPQISLPYATFTSPGITVHDGQNGYQNLFDALVDSVYAALEKVGAGSVEIVVSETGWPTAGGKSTTIDNARTYNNNLIQHVKRGTPRRPGKSLETYIFDMYDENLKSPGLEQNWGLFRNNGIPKYPVNFN